MSATFAITEELWSNLVETLSDSREVGAVLLAGIAGGADTTVLCHSVIPIPDGAYLRRDAHGLSIRSLGYVQALKTAADDRLIPVFMHTHPDGVARHSRADRAVDELLRPVFTLRSEQPRYASVVLGGNREKPEFACRLWEGDRETDLSRVRVVGDRLQILDPNADVPDSGMFDRQIRAFGAAGQALLRSLHVGVVGAGGTGSVVCEQLIRLGVGRVTVLDPDVITEANLSRTYGSDREHLGHPKVEAIARLARLISSGTTVKAMRNSVTEQDAARALVSCDAIFGCTDDHAGRSVISRMAYWYLIPTFDMGFVITSKDGQVIGLDGRVTTVMPGTACLICRGRIDPALIRAEAMDPTERARLAREGYAPELGVADPSVVTYTTLTASVATNELLGRLFGYFADRPSSELLIRLHDREIRSNTLPSLPGHYCSDRSTWGRGDEEPFLGRTWS